MHPACAEYYYKAQKAAKKYVRTALSRGLFPYPLVLDELLEQGGSSSARVLGLITIPMSLIAGTKTGGRANALSGDFMPLLDIDSEFGAKWLSLCDAQLGDEGIRDPIKCYEYMGRFYVEEGNKRVSVLKTMGAVTVSACVTRIVPALSDELPVRLYYEFMDFYELSALYGVTFSVPGSYILLQAKLGFPPDHVWTEDERRRFLSGFIKFQHAFRRLGKTHPEMTDADALLAYLDVFPFGTLLELPETQLAGTLGRILPDADIRPGDEQISLQTAPLAKDRGIISKVMGLTRRDHLKIAFIYAFSPEQSVWTREHDTGMRFLREQLGDRGEIRVYEALDHDFLAKMEQAADDGAEVIFATTPTMISDCRTFAAEHEDIKVLNCSLSQPYRSVRTYYSRIYEVKFITGAIAGAVSPTDTIGYIANYPIFTVPASINAFALGALMTNPKARIRLAWSCTPKDPLLELTGNGITVISNRDAASPGRAHLALEWGLYQVREDLSLLGLAAPRWNWGQLYLQITESILDRSWNDVPRSKAVNYWWGMDSGVVDIRPGEELPGGVRRLARILKDGIIDGSVHPFSGRIVDRDGNIRHDGIGHLSSGEILAMDYLCENVDGSIPSFDEISEASWEIVRRMGVYREYLPPEIREQQL